MEYTALGDTVNIAARLEGVAKPGQIVIGPATAALVDEVIDVNSLGKVNLKGRDEPVEVFEVPDQEVGLAPIGVIPQSVADNDEHEATMS